MSAQEPPALPGEVWRGRVDLSRHERDDVAERWDTVRCVVALGTDPDAPPMGRPRAMCHILEGADAGLADDDRDTRAILAAWAMSLRARVADLERALARYRDADRAGKDTV